MFGTMLGSTVLQFDPFSFVALGSMICLVCVALWFVIWILIAVWVYRDAESRGMGGALWLIIVILLGLIGIIVYLVVRKDKVPGQR